MKEIVASAKDLNFTYKIRNSTAGSLKQTAINSLKGISLEHTVNAVCNLNFEVNKGEILGIVGRNGSGKSTLLKLLAGILPPTNGKVKVNGNIAPLIHLGAGFNPELTGRENIVLFGVLLGNSRRLMYENVESIASWAMLTESIDLPVRTYSTGMMAKLGFAIATFQPAELLIVDEVLSVGDSSFQAKSLERIENLMSEGEATILVSHDLQLIEEKATKVLWLENGNQKMIGDPREVVDAYKKS
jgi:ABC-type polysaccharide/polyol phosphate transport system ATPase subunit